MKISNPEKIYNPISRPLVAAMALAWLAALSLSGCDETKAANAPALQGPPITAAIVNERSINETQQFSGRLEAVGHVYVRARVDGFITSVT